MSGPPTPSLVSDSGHFPLSQSALSLPELTSGFVFFPSGYINLPCPAALGVLPHARVIYAANQLLQRPKGKRCLAVQRTWIQLTVLATMNASTWEEVALGSATPVGHGEKPVNSVSTDTEETLVLLGCEEQTPALGQAGASGKF